METAQPGTQTLESNLSCYFGSMRFSKRKSHLGRQGLWCAERGPVDRHVHVCGDEWNMCVVSTHGMGKCSIGHARLGTLWFE